MQKATLTKVGGKIIIRCPYNARLVEEIRGIPGRMWNGEMKAWSVPAGSEQVVREIIRPFFQIEGEPSYIEYEIVRVKVKGKTSAKRTYCGGVTVDGHEIFNPASGYLDMRPNDVYEILEHEGGFVSGDGYVRRGNGHAFEVEYTLKLKVRKDAEWMATGHADYWGSYEFLPEEKPLEVSDALWAEVQRALGTSEE